MHHANKVQLIGHYGSDEIHGCSAWTSTSRDLTPDKRGRIPKLLADLGKDGHHTPFEKSSLHFLVNTDIATHIHLLKHRIGVSINGESARYKELKEDKFFIPEDWVGISAASEPEGYGFEGSDWASILEEHTKRSNMLYHAALKDLTPVLGRARAKESTRYFKSYNSQIEADVMFNWRSFHHFLNLRHKPNAQKEVRDVAGQMLDLVKNIEGNPFQHTIIALGHGEK